MRAHISGVDPGLFTWTVNKALPIRGMPLRMGRSRRQKL